MTERLPSKDLAIPTTEQLCEGIIYTRGIDRSMGSGVRSDADWESSDVDGSEQKLILTRIQKVGSMAVYTLRVQDALSKSGSVYRFDSANNTLTHKVVRGDGTMTDDFYWDPMNINTLLHYDK